MTYRTEFPEFPEADWPAMPEGFEDNSWHNDVCPSIINAPLRVAVFIDCADPKARETDGGRFIAYTLDDGEMPICDDFTLITDDWDEVLTFIARTRAMQALGLYVLNDDSEPRCGRIYHVMLGDTRKAIAYDQIELTDKIDGIIKQEAN
jgi:hypothetical protein